MDRMNGFKRKRFYISAPMWYNDTSMRRSDNGSCVDEGQWIQISRTKGDWTAKTGFGKSYLITIYPEVWEYLTDIRLKTGEIRRVYITLEPATGNTGKRLYLARRKDGFTAGYELGTSRKQFHKRRGFSADSFILAFCGTEFQDVTGIEMKPGEIVRVNLAIETK